MAAAKHAGVKTQGVESVGRRLRYHANAKVNKCNTEAILFLEPTRRQIDVLRNCTCNECYTNMLWNMWGLFLRTPPRAVPLLGTARQVAHTPAQHAQKNTRVARVVVRILPLSKRPRPGHQLNGSKRTKTQKHVRLPIRRTTTKSGAGNGQARKRIK